MPLQSMLLRLRTVEIFGTLLPGLVVVASAGFVRIAATVKDLAGLERRLIELTSRDPTWLSTVIFIVASYLSGTLVRALPGRNVDVILGRLLRPLFGRPFFGARLNRLYGSRFPYPSMLRHVHEQLTRSGYLVAPGPMERPEPPGDTADSTWFEYWKAIVAARNPVQAFRLEAYESRTRLFYGMFWATLIGFGVALCGWWRAGTPVPLLMAAVSSAMLFVFAIRYRYVTGEEVRAVYIAFLIECAAPVKREQGTTPDDASG